MEWKAGAHQAAGAPCFGPGHRFQEDPEWVLSGPLKLQEWGAQCVVRGIVPHDRPQPSCCTRDTSRGTPPAQSQAASKQRARPRHSAQKPSQLLPNKAFFQKVLPVMALGTGFN